MPSYLDLGVIGVVLVSAILSLMRGFTREVLAIGSWVAAAAAAYYLHPFVAPYLAPYIHKPVVLEAVGGGDRVLRHAHRRLAVHRPAVGCDSRFQDRRARPLARLRVRRGARLPARGCRVRDLQLAGRRQAAAGLGAARQDPADADRHRRPIIALLPEDAATTLEAWIKSKTAPSGADVPADETKPAAVEPKPAPRRRRARRPPPSPGAADRDKLDALINGKVTLPPPRRLRRPPSQAD